VSDGPYKSLNMSPAWKRFAEWAHKPAFECEQVAANVGPALEETWREEGCAETVRRIRKILGNDLQTTMFGKTEAAADLEAARRELAAGFLMRRLIVDHVIQSVANGKLSMDALNEGIENALRDRVGRGPRQVEEHYLRKQSSEILATRVRNRMEDAISSAPISALARRLSGLEPAAALSQSIKQQGIEDGVRLP
jgi:hypothetical protein